MKNIKLFSDLASAIGLTCETPFVASLETMSDNVMFVPTSAGEKIEIIANSKVDGFIDYQEYNECPYKFGTVESHTKSKTDAVVGDICYYGETPIGVVVITTEDTVKVIALECNVSSLWIGVSYLYTKTNVTDKNNGKSNTATLLSICENEGAAYQAYKYSTVGTNKGDWYIPAYNEWLLLDKNIDIINNTLNSLGSSVANCIKEDEGCWTSTEVEWDDMCAYVYTIYSMSGLGGVDTNYKDNPKRVRVFLSI